MLAEPELVDKYKPIQTGVIKTPSKLDMLALKIAEGTFPFAIETMTTEEDTVEGNAAT